MQIANHTLFKKNWILFFILVFTGFVNGWSQRTPDGIYMSNIKTVQLFQQNNQLSMPILNLNSNDLIELHFDDIDGVVKNYFYTFELCNEDWQPANLSTFDYIRGFTSNRLSQYRVSSIAQTRYIHYQAILPDRNCMPTKSGNYLLKVFLNSDTNQLVFTKRFFVVEKKATVVGLVLQPFNNEYFRTHQRVQFSVDVQQLNPINPQQQVKVVVMQNYRWDNVVRNIQPTFLRGDLYEYNGEQDCLFAGGKEYRWADLRSFRFESDRVQSINKNVQPNEVFLKPDAQRSATNYTYFRDWNGWYNISTTESINPFWQTDYATVNFTFVPNNHQAYTNKEVYITGTFLNNVLNENSKMTFNADKGVYEKSLFLKQGYYTYTYLTKDIKDNRLSSSVLQTDGSYWETENDYCIFVYYRSLSGRHDELVGLSTLNSRNGRPF